MKMMFGCNAKVTLNFTTHHYLSIYVLIAHCPEDLSMSSHGSYTWPRSNNTQNHSQPCVHGGLSINVMATRRCNERGEWEAVDFIDCWTQSEFILNSIVSV